MTHAIFASALRDIFNSPVGEDAVFARSSGGAATNCRVIVNKDILLQPAGMDTQVYERGTSIEVILEDIGGDAPNRGDTFVVGLTTYTVQSIDKNDGCTAEAIVT